MYERALHSKAERFEKLGVLMLGLLMDGLLKPQQSAV
jgi:hypothetical protein